MVFVEYEVCGEYKMRKDLSIYVKFLIEWKEKEYFFIWMIMFWILLVNFVVVVYLEYEYVKVKVEIENGEEYWIMVKVFVERVFSEVGVKGEIVEMFKGEEFEGICYIYVFFEEYLVQKEFCEKYEWVYCVIFGEYVMFEDGIGLVYIVFGYGEEDFEVGQCYGLLVYSLVDDVGRYIEGKWKGVYVKDVDFEIIEYFKEKGYFVKVGEIEYKYLYCWCCKILFIFCVIDQWFFKVSKVKDQIIKENDEKVIWYFEWVKVRYDNGVMNFGDWVISRQRYWGILFLIWESEDGEYYVVGSFEEFVKFVVVIEVNGERIDFLEGYEEKLKIIEEKFGLEDFYRFYVDVFIIKVNGKEMKCVKDVVDVWFDSGIVSWVFLDYLRNKELFEKFWLVDFIVEGED